MVDLEKTLAKGSLEDRHARAIARRPSATASPIVSWRAAWNVHAARSPRAPQRTRRQGRLQPRRHLRRRVRKLHAVSLFELRIRVRSQRLLAQEGHDPGQRPQPHRPGNRVRLLLLPRLLRAAGIRRRVDHGQLQSGDRLHRLRHQRPPLLRAPHARRSAEHLRHRKARRRDRAVRRPDAADAGAPAQSRRRPDHRHRSRQHRSGRRPQAVRQAARRSENSVARQRLGDQRRRGLRHRPLHRLPGAGAPQLRARRPRHGDRLRRRHRPPLHAGGRDLLAKPSRADRSLPRRRHRSRRRRPRRFHRRRPDRRHHGAHRRSRRALRRFQLRAARHLARARNARHHQDLHREAGARAQRHRPDERAVRGEGRQGLRARSEPARLAHRPLRQQSHRRGAARRSQSA